MGYAVGVFPWPDNNERLVLPGLKVSDVSSIKGKSDQVGIKADRQFFDRYIGKIIGAHNDLQLSNTTILEEAMHDLRRMNSSIKNLASELDDELKKRFVEKKLTQLSGNIIASSEIFTGRLDFIDLSVSGSAPEDDIQTIYIYRKIDKAVRTFKSEARSKNVAAGRIVRHVHDYNVPELGAIRTLGYTLPGEEWRFSAIIFLRRDGKRHPDYITAIIRSRRHPARPPSRLHARGDYKPSSYHRRVQRLASR